MRRSPHLTGIPDQSAEVAAAIERLNRGAQLPGDRRLAREAILALRDAIKSSWDPAMRRKRGGREVTRRVEIMEARGFEIEESEG